MGGGEGQAQGHSELTQEVSVRVLRDPVVEFLVDELVTKGRIRRVIVRSAPTPPAAPNMKQENANPTTPKSIISTASILSPSLKYSFVKVSEENEPGFARGRGVLVNPKKRKRSELCSPVATNTKGRKRQKKGTPKEKDESKKTKKEPKNKANEVVVDPNRTFYHSTTVVPIPKGDEGDTDSEGDLDQKMVWWEDSCRMIEDFNDVNDGEKEVMKCWNLHMLRRSFRHPGDRQIPRACLTFVDDFASTIIDKNLYGNFILHMCNLYDFKIITAETFHTTVNRMQSRMEKNSPKDSSNDVPVPSSTSQSQPLQPLGLTSDNPINSPPKQNDLPT